MKKGLRITLQIILYLLSISILMLSHEFPNDLIGVSVISLFIGFSTYYLWNKTSKNIIIKSIFILIVLETLKMYGGDGVDTLQKISYHFSNLVNWFLPTIMIIVLFLLLLKVLFFDKKKLIDDVELKKK